MTPLPTALRWAMQDLEACGIDPMRNLDLAKALTNLYLGIIGGDASPITAQIRKDERICQLVVVPVNLTSWVEVEHLDVTERGEGGFGSTGK